ncbi:MAG: hypothetical protein GF409_06495 [Candidatus Omnitrophica bacterium]|nr:hypothetical protein [Candidatus Omnitrophota bacterium]
MYRRTISVIVLLACFSPAASASEADLQRQIDELKQQMHQMSTYYERKINELEKKLAGAEHGRAMDEDIHHKGEHAHGVSHSKDLVGHKHHHGILGDKVSVIGAFDARYVNIEKQKNSLFIHEAKIGAQAQITDWLFAYVTFSKHHGEDIDIEEAYAVLGLEQFNLSAKPGKFFVNFGPENLAHFFDRRTITLSAMHVGIFGNEPWADTGLQLDWRIPLGFYSNLGVSVLNGDNAASFGDGQNEVSNNNMPVAVNWSNAFETDHGFFKLGNSFAWGRWDRNDEYDVYLIGGDAYYRLGDFDAQFELIYRRKDLPAAGEENAYGYYLWGAYNFPLDYKYLKGIEFLAGFGQFIPDTGDRETRITPQVSLLFNDFAKLRATYEVREQYPKDRKDNRFITQFALAF